MTHEEFIDAVLDTGQFTEPSEMNRLFTEGAILSPGLIRRLMKAIPSAGEYLRKRSPEAFAFYEQVKKYQKARKANRTRVVQLGDRRVVVYDDLTGHPERRERLAMMLDLAMKLQELRKEKEDETQGE